MLRVFTMLALTLLGGYGIPVAAGPLDRPAQMSSISQKGALLSVARAGQRLVSVGERGHILLSDDAGASWRQVPAPASTTLTAVAFADERVGIAVGHGGVILRTRDAGETWVRVADGRTIARQIAQLAGSATTADAGAGLDKPLLDVRFANPRSGIAVGADGLVLSTGDAGLTWTTLTDGMPAEAKRHLYAVVPAADGWYVAGEQGALYRSADGGRSFNRLQSPYRGSYFGMLASPGGGIVVFGLRGNAWRSADQGMTWKRAGISTQASLIGGTVQDNGTLVLFDEVGGIWISKDDGRHFQPGPPGKGFPVSSAIQIAPGRLIAVGPRGMVRLFMNPTHQEDETHVH